MGDKRYQNDVKDVEYVSLDITAIHPTLAVSKPKAPYVEDPVRGEAESGDRRESGSKTPQERSESGGNIEKGFRVLRVFFDH